jgi:DNA-binding response OmpR family regulator
MKILVVEDSQNIQRTLGVALRESGHVVDLASDGDAGLSCAEWGGYDLIVLDIMLPGRDGLSVLAELRRKGREVHVLLLTALDGVPDRVKGLEIGADDYLPKPFALEELLARVQALGRRAFGCKRSRLRLGEIEIDLGSRSVFRGGRGIELTSREYKLLEYLARRSGEVVSREELEAHLYDDQVDPVSNVVDSTICLLRKKIGSPGAGSLIRTRRGLGYVIEDLASRAVEA